jgi:hypothetical protein
MTTVFAAICGKAYMLERIYWREKKFAEIFFCFVKNNPQNFVCFHKKQGDLRKNHKKFFVLRFTEQACCDKLTMCSVIAFRGH